MKIQERTQHIHLTFTNLENLCTNYVAGPLRQSVLVMSGEPKKIREFAAESLKINYPHPQLAAQRLIE